MENIKRRLEELDFSEVKIDSVQKRVNTIQAAESLRMIYVKIAKLALGEEISSVLHARALDVVRNGAEKLFDIMKPFTGKNIKQFTLDLNNKSDIIISLNNKILNPTDDYGREIGALIQILKIYSEDEFETIYKNQKDIAIDIRNIKKTLKKYNDPNTNPIKEMEALKIKSKEVYDDILKYSKEVIISKYAEEFETNSGKKKVAANVWLFIGFIFTVTFIILLGIGTFDLIQKNDFTNVPKELEIENFYDNEWKTNTTYYISKTISKALLISIMIYILLFISKQYIVNKNLEVINKHKATALNSFIVFKNIMGDKNAAVDALMAEVAKTIYINPNSGYIKSGSENNFGSAFNQISKEIIKESKNMASS